MKHYFACDLGAESGRAMLGSVSENGLILEELHRFANIPVRTPAGLYWDVFRLYHEIQEGLAVAGRNRRLSLAGIGVDTWGVDFGLVGRDGSVVASPMHYRDSRNDGMLEKTFAVIPQGEIFAQTGIQFMQFNTLYQLHAMKLSERGVSGCAAGEAPAQLNMTSAQAAPSTEHRAGRWRADGPIDELKAEIEGGVSKQWPQGSVGWLVACASENANADCRHRVSSVPIYCVPYLASSFWTSSTYSRWQASRPCPCSRCQASNFARPLKSSRPGRLPRAFPAVACLYSPYRASSSSAVGCRASRRTRSCAATKSSSDAMAGA